MAKLIPRIRNPELIFGFVSPIGTDLRPALEAFKAFFRETGYNPIEIKVTDRFQPLSEFVKPHIPLQDHPLHSRYDTYISYGNRIREVLQDDSILGALAIEQIVRERLKTHRDDVERRFTANVYLVHQFKREEEIDLLRAVYGRIFFQVSVYSRRGSRVEYLSRKFAESLTDPSNMAYRGRAEELIDRDENETRVPHGQRVGRIFHNADFIINLDAAGTDVHGQIGRFCELLFSSNSISPSRMEYGMFTAHSAALRSLDLSRQVGAAIFSRFSEILSMGSNEVPKAGGGTYFCDDEHDAREFVLGYDSNQKRKQEIVDEIARAIAQSGEGERDAVRMSIDKTSLTDAVEYGRVMHAEMSAIADAARMGRSLARGTMYCTTFPCHICAKHIVASGLSDVIFLEPYPKSLAGRLHSDSIEVERADRGRFDMYPAVKFSHFFGITPRRYRELFQRGRRKDDRGEFQHYIGGEKKPLPDIKSPFYAQLEDTVLSSVRKNAGFTLSS